AGDPPPLVATEPRDEARRVVGLAPAAERHPSRRVQLGEAPARLGGARIDTVDRDAAVGELLRERRGRDRERAFRAGTRAAGGVVGRPAVREDVRAVLLEPPRDREADPRPAADAGDERPLQVVSTPTTSRTPAELDSSARRSSSERSSSTICSMPLGPSLTGT